MEDNPFFTSSQASTIKVSGTEDEYNPFLKPLDLPKLETQQVQQNPISPPDNLQQMEIEAGLQSAGFGKSYGMGEEAVAQRKKEAGILNTEVPTSMLEEGGMFVAQTGLKTTAGVAEGTASLLDKASKILPYIQGKKTELDLDELAYWEHKAYPRLKGIYGETLPEQAVWAKRAQDYSAKTGRSLWADMSIRSLRNNAQYIRDELIKKTSAGMDVASDIAGAVLSSAPGIAEFAAGPVWAGLQGAIEAKEMGLGYGMQAAHAVKSTVTRMAAGQFFHMLHPLSKKYGLLGQFEQAALAGSWGGAESLARPAIDDFIDRRLLDTWKAAGFDIRDMEKYNNHLQMKMVQERTKWNDAIQSFTVMALMGSSPKPSDIQIPKNLRKQFGSMYFDPRDKKHMDLFRAFNQGAMFTENGGIVEIEPVLYEKGHRSIFGQALEEAGYQILYGDIPATEKGKPLGRIQYSLGRIIVDNKYLQETFDKQIWTGKRMGLPKDYFKTIEEWEDFVLSHELAHLRTKLDPKDFKTYEEYEEAVDKKAIELGNQLTKKPVPEIPQREIPVGKEPKIKTEEHYPESYDTKELESLPIEESDSFMPELFKFGLGEQLMGIRYYDKAKQLEKPYQMNEGRKLVESPKKRSMAERRALTSEIKKTLDIMSLPSITTEIGHGVNDGEARAIAGNVVLASIGTNPDQKGHVPWSGALQVEYIGKVDGVHIINYEGKRWTIPDSQFRLVSDRPAGATDVVKHNYRGVDNGELDDNYIKSKPYTAFISTSKLQTSIHDNMIYQKLGDFTGDLTKDINVIEKLVDKIKKMALSSKNPTRDIEVPAQYGFVFDNLVSGKKKGYTRTWSDGEIGDVVIVRHGNREQRFIIKDKIFLDPALVIRRESFSDVNPESAGMKWRKSESYNEEFVKAWAKNELISADRADEYKNQYQYILEPIKRVDDVELSLAPFAKLQEKFPETYSKLVERLNEAQNFIDNVKKHATIKEISSETGKLYHVDRLVSITENGERVFLTKEGSIITENGQILRPTAHGFVKPLYQGPYRLEPNPSRPWEEYMVGGPKDHQMHGKLFATLFKWQMPAWAQKEFRLWGNKERITFFDLLKRGYRIGNLFKSENVKFHEVGDLIPITHYDIRKEGQIVSRKQYPADEFNQKDLSMEEQGARETRKTGLLRVTFKEEANIKDFENKEFLKNLADAECMTPQAVKDFYLNPTVRKSVFDKNGNATFLRYEMVLDPDGAPDIKEYGRIPTKAEELNVPKLKRWTNQDFQRFRRARLQYEYDRIKAKQDGEAKDWCIDVDHKATDLWERLPKADRDKPIDEVLNDILNQVPPEPYDIERRRQMGEVIPNVYGLSELMQDGISKGYPVPDVINIIKKSIESNLGADYRKSFMEFVRDYPDIEVNVRTSEPELKFAPIADVQKQWGHNVSDKKLISKGTDIPVEVNLPTTEAEAKIMAEANRYGIYFTLPMDRGFIEYNIWGSGLRRKLLEHNRIVREAFSMGKIDPMSDIAKQNYIIHPDIYWDFGKPYRDFIFRESARRLEKESKVTTEEFSRGKLFEDRESSRLEQMKEYETTIADRKGKAITGESGERTLRRSFETDREVNEKQVYQQAQLEGEANISVDEYIQKTAESANTAIDTLCDDFIPGLAKTKKSFMDALRKTFGGKKDLPPNDTIITYIQNKLAVAKTQQERIELLKQLSDAKVACWNLSDYSRLSGMPHEEAATQIFIQKGLNLFEAKAMAEFFMDNYFSISKASGDLDDLVQSTKRLMDDAWSSGARGTGYKTREELSSAKERFFETKDWYVNRVSNYIYLLKDIFDFYPHATPAERQQFQEIIDFIKKNANKPTNLWNSIAAPLTRADRRLVAKLFEVNTKLERKQRKLYTSPPGEDLVALQQSIWTQINNKPEKVKKAIDAAIYGLQNGLNISTELLQKVGLFDNKPGPMSRYSPLNYQIYEIEAGKMDYKGKKLWTMGLPGAIRERVQSYLFSLKKGGVTHGQYRDLTIEDIINHITRVEIDVFLQTKWYNIANMMDITPHFKDVHNKFFLDPDTNIVEPWARPGKRIQGKDILDELRAADKLTPDIERRIKPEVIYEAWSPHWETHEMDRSGDKPVQEGYKQTYMMPLDSIRYLNNFKEPVSTPMYVMNRLHAHFKEYAILLNLGRYVAGNLFGDTSIMGWMHPELHKLIPEIGPSMLLLTKMAINNHPHLVKLLNPQQHASITAAARKIGLDKNYTREELAILESVVNQGILEAGMLTETVRSSKPNIISKGIDTLFEGIQGREALLRLANAIYVKKAIERDGTDAVAKRFHFLGTLEQAKNSEGVWDANLLMTRIAREMSIDYMRKSPGYSQWISGFVMPFGKFYIDFPKMWWRWTYDAVNPNSPLSMNGRVRRLIRASGSVFFAPVMAAAVDAAMDATLTDDERDARRRYKAGLNPNLKMKPYILARRPNADGTWDVWNIPDPFSMAPTMRLPSTFVGVIRQVMDKEISIEQAFTTLHIPKQWLRQEGEGLAYIVTPLVRFVRGMVNKRDPYDGTTVAPQKDWDNFNGLQKANYMAQYFIKCMSPWMAVTMTQTKDRTVWEGMQEFAKDYFDPYKWMGVATYEAHPEEDVQRNVLGGWTGRLQTTKREQETTLETKHNTLLNEMVTDAIMLGMDADDFERHKDYNEFLDKFIKKTTDHFKDKEEGRKYAEDALDSFLERFADRMDKPAVRERLLRSQHFKNRVRWWDSGEEKVRKEELQRSLMREISEAKGEKYLEAHEGTPESSRGVVEYIEDMMMRGERP